ncbi:MAG: hypothetical protein ACLUGI_05555 [Subdoligranulum sp.]
MSPLQVKLSAEGEKQALLAHQELLQNSGVEVDDYGGFTGVVRAVPADVPVDDVPGISGCWSWPALFTLNWRDRDAPLRRKPSGTRLHCTAAPPIKAGDRTTTDENAGPGPREGVDGSVPRRCVPRRRLRCWKLTRKGAGKTVWTPCV